MNKFLRMLANGGCITAGLVVGSVLGTIILGPGLGTLIGFVAGAFIGATAEVALRNRLGLTR
jgi:hypothetical protein